MRRDDICLYLGPADRAQLQALLTDRNTPRKVVWRAEFVLATADGCGTNEIMRRADTSKPPVWQAPRLASPPSGKPPVWQAPRLASPPSGKPTVWRWRARYLDEVGLGRDKTRPSRVPPLPRETRLKVITWTVQETPPDATHWSRALMAGAVGISPSSVGL